MIIYAFILRHHDDESLWHKASDMIDLYEKSAIYLLEKYLMFRVSKFRPIALKDLLLEDNFENASDIINSQYIDCFKVKYTTTDDYSEENKEINICHNEIQRKMDELISNNLHKMF